MTGARAPEFPFDDWGAGIAREYAALRRSGEPVCRVRTVTGDLVWLVTRYDVARRVLTDPRFSLSAALAPDAPRQEPVRPRAEGSRGDGTTTLTQAALGGLWARALGPEAVRSHQAWTRDRARLLLDRLRAVGPPGDLQRDLARPLTFGVACRALLGDLSWQEGQQLDAWCDTALVWREQPRSAIRAALDSLHAFFLRRAPALAAGGGGTVLARAAESRVRDGGRLGREGLAEVATLMFVAGYRTAASFVANALVTLASQPHVASVARESAALVPAVVEELLRHTPMSTGGVRRVAIEDVRLGGVTVRAGECVLISLESANHDPDGYPEPDRFDAGRFAVAGAGRPHVGFGHGLHHCPGDGLARMQLGVVVEGLAAWDPPPWLTVPVSRLAWRPDVVLRIPEAIPVTW